MNRDPEALLDQTHQFLGGYRRLSVACFGDESHDLLGQLVRLFRAALVGHEAGESCLFEGRQGLIKRGPREAEGCRSAGHRLALALHAAKHLVLDLHEVARVEETVLEEQFVGDTLLARIQSSLLPQRLELGLFVGHQHLVVVRERL